jgi:hypothetical protein
VEAGWRLATISLVLTAGAIWLTARGVKLSATAVGAAVLVQVAIMGRLIPAAVMRGRMGGVGVWARTCRVVRALGGQ